MFARTFKSLFLGRKKQPIVNAHKVPKARKRVVLGLELLEDRVTPANFTAGNLAVLQLAAASTNTTGSILELSPTTANQASSVQTVSIASTGANALRFSDSGTSGFLSDSNDGTQLVLAAYNTTDSTTTDLATTGTSATTGTDPDDRAVATIANSPNLTIQTHYVEPTSGDQTRSAATLNDTNYAITDKGGLFTNNAATPSLSTNILVTRAFGGTLYVASTKATAGVSTISSPTATSLSGLPGFPADANIQDFYLIQSGNNGSTYDVLYTVDQSGSGQINKYSLVSGSWVANGNVSLANGNPLLAGDTSMIAANDGAGGAYLYVVTTSQSLGNSVVRLTDTTGFDQTINVNAANNVTLYTTSSTTTLKGIAFAPVASGSVAPSLPSTGSTNVYYQNTGSFQITATGNPAPTYSLSGAPSFATINSTTGLISFSASQPTETSTTNYTFTVVASNGVGSPASEAFTVGVVYGAPAFSSANNTSIYASQSGTFQVVANAGPPVTGYSLSGAPSWATINSSTGLITFTNAPAVSTTTPVSFTVNATNSVGTTPQTFTVTDLPTISYSSTSNAAVTQNFSTLPVSTEAPTSGTGNPVDGPYDLTTSSTGAFGASGLAGWYAANLDVGTALKFAEGEPGATTGALFDFNDGTSGSQSLGTISTSSSGARFGAVLVNNSGLTLNSFTLSYTGEEWWANTGTGSSLNFSYEIGSPAIPNNNTGVTTVSSLGFTGPVTGSGSALDGSLSANQVAVNGTVNNISWAPGQTLTIFWDKGTTGTSDGLGIANVSFSAQHLNQLPPTITNAPSAYATVGNTSTYQLAANGFPTPTWSLTGAPSWVTVNTNTGLLTFTTPPALPTAGTDVAFTFTVNATNAAGSAPPQTFTVIETTAAVAFTPGNLLLLQTGNNNPGNPVYSAEAPVSLQEITTSGAAVQNVPIPDNTTVGGTGNQPLSLDLATQVKGGTGANGSGDGQLERSYDSSEVSFGGNDDQLGATDFSTSNRVIGLVGVNPTTSINTTIYGAFNGGDDNRGVVVGENGEIYNFGHTTNGGLRNFGTVANPAASPTSGTEVDTTTTKNNVRDAIVGFNGQLYYSSAKSTTPGIFISETSNGVPVYDPTVAGTDTEVIADPDAAGDPNGMFLADMNGDGILDTNDRMYFLDSTNGLYVSTYTSATGNNPYGTWSTPTLVNGGAPTPVSGATNYVGLAGQVVNNNTVQLYFTSADGAGNSTVWSLTDTGSPSQTANVIASTTSAATGGIQYNGIAFAPLNATTISETINGSTGTVNTNPGQTVTFTANVSSPNGSVNGGTVYFDDANSGAPLGSATIVNGVATFTTSTLNAGQYSVYAYYAGNSSIAAASTAQQALSITGTTASSTSLTTTPSSPTTAGETVTLTATVSGTGGTATGNVNFYDGTALIGTATLNGSGVATLSVSTFSVATHSLTATYTGNNTYAPSTSSPADSLVVNAGATLTVNDGSTNAYGTVAAGTSVTFTATVAGNGLSGNPNGSPSGSVQFYEDGVAVGSPVTLTGTGNALTATKTITIGQSGNQTGGINGSHLITATYIPASSSYASVSSTVPWIETAQQTFGHGNLLVLDRPNQPSNASQLVGLDEYTPNGVLVQTVYLPDQTGGTPGQAGVTTNTFGLSGHAATEGALALSGNESYLSAFGFDLPLGTVGATSTSSATNPRTALSITVAGVINSSTTVEEPNDDALTNARGAVTNNGSTYYVVGDASTTNTGIALATNGTLNDPPTSIGTVDTQGYGAEILGGQLYVSTQDSTSPIEQVGGPGLPTGAATFTALPGLETAYQTANLFTPPGGPSKLTPNPYGFLLFNHLNGTSVNPDTLYIADQTYGLLKFALVGGNWVFESQKLNNNNGIEGLAGYEMNPGASGYSFVLYATAAISTGNPGNQLVQFTDSAAYNAANSGGLFNVLASATNSTDTFSGLAFAPLDLTTTAVSATPTIYGTSESTVLTATVVDTNNTDSPTGTVTFYANGVAIGTGTLSTNPGTTETATFTYNLPTPLAVGSHPIITASYGGDSNDGTSSSSAANLNVDYTPGDVIVTTVGTDATVGSIASITESGTTATVTTSAANTLVTGQTVTLSGVTPTGYNSLGTSTYTVTVTNPTTFTITATAGLGGTSGSGPFGTVSLGLNGNATTTTLEDFTGSTLNASNTVTLSTPGTTATISGITESGTTATVTTSAAHGFAVGEEVTIAGSSVGGYNATYNIASIPTPTTFTVTAAASLVSATGGSATITNNLAEVGTTKNAGYLADSLNGQSLTLAGYNAGQNGGTSGNRDIGVISADGSVNLSTQLPSAVGTVSAAISADGQGFYVATGTGMRYVSFGGTTPSVISAASWANGTATLTAPNSYIVGQTVVVSGITGATGYNGTFVVTAASATGFSYYLATNPGTATFTGLPTSQLLPTLLTTEADNPNYTGQVPTSVEIGTSPNGSPNQLYGTAGNQFFDGVPSVDGPFTVGSGLPESAGQSIAILGNGTGQNFPSSPDVFGNYPTSNQIAISPDGQTIFIADSRTDGLGGILEYTQTVPGSWVLLGRLQVDNFAITGATESGTTVTITTSAATDYSVGESVTVEGLINTAYDGTYTIQSVSNPVGGPYTFTYTGSSAGLPSSTPGTFGASVTSADGGFYSLVANFNGSAPVLYATTSNVSGNRLLEITGGTTDQSYPSFSYTVLATAPTNEAFRGVALAPTAAGTTASTTSLSVSPSSSDFASGVTLTATVTSGATGWVSFQTTINGVLTEIGAAQITNGTATLNTGGDLPPGAYNITAVYLGDSTYAGSSSTTKSATITKTSTSTSTSLTFSPPTVGTAQSDILTAIISAPAGVAPTGTVTFTNTTSSTTLGTATVSQVIVDNSQTNYVPTLEFEAVLTVPAGTFTAGAYTISATYSGDGYFSGSTGTGSLSVVNSTTTTVTSNVADPTASTDEALTLTAAVTSTAGGTPAGTVQFYDGTLALGGPVTLNGRGLAALTVNTSLVQSVTVTNASNSTSGGVTTVTLTTDANNPMTVGESVTVEGITTGSYNGTFTVTAVNGDAFSYVDSRAQGSANGTASGLAVGLNVLTPGLDSISAYYTPTGSSLTSFSTSTGVLEQSVQGQAIGANDIFQERNGDGITSLDAQPPSSVAGSIGVTIFLDELTQSGTLVQSFALPTADSQAFNVMAASESGTTVSITTASPNNYAIGQLVTIAGVTGANTAGYNGTFTITGVSGNTFTYTATSGLGTATVTGATAQGVVHAVVGNGQQSSTGQMTLSGSGQALFVSGYDNDPTNPTAATLPVPTATNSQNVPRSIAVLDANGTVETEAFSTSMSLNSSKSAIFDGVYSPDGNQFYLSGYNGIYYFSSLTQSASLQGSNAANQILSEGSTVYALESYGGNLYAVAAGSSSAKATDIWQVGTGLPVADESTVTGASWASGVATITANNNYVVGQSVAVAGITGATTFNGTFTITGATSTSFTYALATQPTGTPAFAAATASLQAVVTQLPGIPVNTSSEPDPVYYPTDIYLTHTNGAGTALDTIYISDNGTNYGNGGITKWSLVNDPISSITESGTTATVTLSAATLGLYNGETVNITISGSSVPGYNGTFSATVTSPTTFTFTAASGLGTAATPGTASAFVENGDVNYYDTVQQLGFYYLAGTTNPTTHAVTLYSTYGNGGNTDVGPGITYSVTDTNGYNAAPGVAITAASWSSGTVTITAANNFVAGQYVNVSGITPSSYDGLFTIATANATSFTYALSSNPGTATVAGANALSVTTLNSVAYEGPSSYSGNETTRGVATAPQAVTDTLVDNGPNPASLSQSFTLTDTVSSPAGFTPAGTVTLEYFNGTTNVVVPTTGGTLDSSGVATLTVAAGALPSGSYSLFAVYSGDSYHQTENSNTVSQVVLAPTTTTLTSATNPSVVGSAVNFTVTVSPSVPDGESVNLYDASEGNALVGTGMLSGGTVTISVSGLSAGTHEIYAVYGGDATYAGSQSSQLAQTVNSSNPPPTISNVVINEDISALYNAAGQPSAGKQRSMVDDVVYTFSEPVNITSASVESNVFTVQVASGYTGTVPTLSWAPVAGTNNTEWAVTFSGNGVSGNSIANGAYNITVNDPTAITAQSDSQALSLGSSGTIGGATQSFYRLFGDINGDEVVNALDNARFKTALTTYNPAFDFNDDGVVNALDNARFKNDLSVNFTGFTATI